MTDFLWWEVLGDYLTLRSGVPRTCIWGVSLPALGTPTDLPVLTRCADSGEKAERVGVTVRGQAGCHGYTRSRRSFTEGLVELGRDIHRIVFYQYLKYLTFQVFVKLYLS